VVDINNTSFLFVFSGVLVLSYSSGAIFSLLLESPFFELQKFLKTFFIINERESVCNNFNINESDGNEMKNLYKSVDKNQIP
jgi:hypothetical protein